MVDAIDSDIMYLGTDFGGIFKSSDGGTSWQAIPSPDAIYYTSFAQTGTKIYVTTNTGLFESEDEGLSWTELPSGLSSPMLDALLIDPSNPSTLYGASNVYCGQGGVVIKSEDAGANWTELCVGHSVAAVDAIAIDPVNTDILYAGTGCCGGGIFKSDDGGATWTEADSGLPASSIHALLVDPANSTSIWSGTTKGLFKSEDSAASWQTASINAPATDFNVSALLMSAQTMYTGISYTLDGDESHYNRVYKSVNSGTDWQNVSDGLGLELSDRIESMCVSPSDPSRLVLGTYGEGVYTSHDGASSWTLSNEGIRAIQIQSLASDSSNLIVGALVGGAYRSSNGGNNWTRLAMGNQIDALVMDRINIGTIYAVSDRKLIKSTDMGDSWSTLSPGHTVHCLGLAPSEPTRIYAGGCGQPISRSDDGGQTWALTAWDGDNTCVIGIAVDPQNPDLLFATASGGWPNGGLYKSDDGGDSWQTVTTGLASNALRIGLVFKPGDGQVAFLGTKDTGIYRTMDGGQSWNTIDAGQGSVNAIAFDPQGQFIYAVFSSSSAQRVIMSENMGESWTDLSGDLPDFGLQALTIDPRGTLFVGSNGGGVFALGTGSEPDGGTSDAGTDAGIVDAGTDADRPDAGPDAGSDAGADAGTVDGEAGGDLLDAGADSGSAGDDKNNPSVSGGCSCSAASGQTLNWLYLLLAFVAIRKHRAHTTRE